MCVERKIETLLKVMTFYKRNLNMHLSNISFTLNKMMFSKSVFNYLASWPFFWVNYLMMLSKRFVFFTVNVEKYLNMS